MTIVKWQVSPYASTPDRREYDKETECFYLYRSGKMNVARRDAKSSSYYRYFDSEQEALDFIRQRNENKAEQKRVDQIKRHAVELLEALEAVTNDLFFRSNANSVPRLLINDLRLWLLALLLPGLKGLSPRPGCLELVLFGLRSP